MQREKKSSCSDEERMRTRRQVKKSEIKWECEIKTKCPDLKGECVKKIEIARFIDVPGIEIQVPSLNSPKTPCGFC